MVIERVSLNRDMFHEAKEVGLTFGEIIEREARKQAKFVDDGKLTALQQQLAARDLQLAGAHASLVDDFFQTEDNKLLFVETINEFVRLGMKEERESFVNMNELVATRTPINGVTFQGAEVDLENSKGTARRVGEKGKFSKVAIQFKEKSQTLYKFGYEIEATYETIRRMKVNAFGVTMKVLGKNIAQDKVAIALDTLINGDGNSNPISSINAGTSGTLAYADVVNLEEEFKYFEPNLMIGPKAMRVAYRNLTEYKDKNGPDMPKPPKKSEGMPANKIIALDAKACLEEVYESGGSLVEHDKIINQQIETAVVSEVSGFSKLFKEAAIMLNVTYS